MKFSRKVFIQSSIVAAAVVAGAMAARAALPEWIQNIEARSLIEGAIFRTMQLPGGPTAVRRPPAETVPALGELIKQRPQQADLYSLKALEEEQKLDFSAAESDWKLYLQNSSDKAPAQLALADFYHRRHRPQDEVNALSALGRLPSPPAEKFTSVTDQQSWRAFERIFQVISAQALGRNISEEQYNAWIARYPQERGLYGRYFEYLLNEKDFKSANDLVAKYHAKFPDDEVFPTKTRALLAYRQGSVEEGLAVYDKSFQPLWPPELVKDYFDLLKETRSQRKFLDQSRAALVRNPDDLNAAARIFYYYQQLGNFQAAQQTITDYRLQKDARKAQWTSQELYTFARLLEDVHLYPESARYYYALYNGAGPDASAPEKALAGLSRILLTAPEQQIRLGSGDLSMYRDIANMDTGPGYLNGILSLLLNTTQPAAHYSEEEQRAVPYFHRSRAAELLALLDKRFPSSSSRPELHARLIEAYAGYGQSDAVIRAGREFLSGFPSAPQRNQVALLMADAFARTNNTKEEFAIYDSMLQELARKAEGVPLGERFNEAPAAPQYQDNTQNNQNDAEGEGDDESGQRPTPRGRPISQQGAFAVSKSPSATQAGVRSPEYQRVLDRYIGRLVSLKQIPAALVVWRQELDRNPNDPGLYERFAAFLESNRLGTEEEAVYKRAIQQFPGKNWYHKLARWYLTKKRNQDLQALSYQVLKIFSGSELEAYLDNVAGQPGQLSLEFNQFAHERFPHNLAFVRHLMELYRSKQFRNDALWEAVLRQHWFEDDALRNQFFEFLSRTGKLDAELQGLTASASPAKGDWTAPAVANPGGVRFIAEAELWRSHFEAGAPVVAAVAQQYPADAGLGRRAASVYRSLAYFEPKDTEVAVQIESNLLKASPADRDTLARIGDIYSDRELFNKAVPYWNQMPGTEPGKPASYEEATTVFWDYYFFDDALRLLNLGRTKLSDDSLYSYQVGAIYENKRDYSRAVDEYVKGSLVSGAYSESRGRLLQLATRKSSRDLVDAATDKAVIASKYDLTAIDLRVAVLEAQSRKTDVAVFLNTVLDRSNSVEVLEAVENMAKEKSLEAVRQHSLERQAAVSNDPIRRLELRYALVTFYEQKKDVAAAQRNVDALYQENPKIMGVVRSTVDFYWRNRLQQKAIDVLLQAANSAYPALKTQFTYEAARKMTETGQYQPARKLLLGLLENNPYNAEYLAAVADTYARSGDQAGLRDFYLEKIKLFQKSTLSQDERKARIAALRRGLVPALTSLKDYAGAVDQYVEIINAYPEDAGLTTEAAYYAQRYQRKDQLLSFYAKTVAASPKDSRWAVVLARVQANYEDFDAAIRTYSQAIKVRPDRTDLMTARAALEERLSRFDDAAADYASLYELAYHDTKWMEKVAEIRARQSKPDLVVQALKTALLDGRPEAAGKYFTVAERLDGWGMLAQAREYAEKGVSVAGDDLLANSDNHAGAQVYTRIMTRLRQQEAAYQRLQAGVAGAQQLPSLAQQVGKNGLDAVTNAELRKNLLLTRTSNAHSGMAACMREMGTVAAKYFTPEEKLAMARALDAKNAALSREQAYEYLMPLAEKAGFAEFQVKLLYEQAQAGRQDRPWLQTLEPLQVRRLRLMELGGQWERIAGASRQETKMGYLQRSAQTFNMAGSSDDELRVYRKMDAISPLSQDRYFELLLAKAPQELESMAASKLRRDAVANFLLAHSDLNRSLSAIHAGRLERPAVWDSAYSALAGLYFTDLDIKAASSQTQSAFQTALSDRTIGERLGKPVDRNQALAGDIWFYYGSRYGEYLGATKKGDPEDFLPAEMEHTPARPAAYFSAALYYEDSGDQARAIADYQHVMELAPQRLDVHNRLAGIYWKQKKNDQAIAEWKRVVELLKAQAGTRGTPETFWGDYSATVNNLATRRLLAQFQPDIVEILHAYVRNNGVYRVLPLLQSTLPKLENSAAATALALDLANDSPEKLSFLRRVISATNLHLDPEPLYARILTLAQEQVEKSEGGTREYAQGQLEGLRVEWLQYLFKTKQYDRARGELSALPKEMWDSQQAALVPLQLKLAALNNTLGPLIEGYRADAEHAPASDVLRKTATELQQAGDKQSARTILEFVFAREIENHNLTAANMLGLADIRIQSGDLESGAALLRRMALVVGNPFETQDPAAALLMRTGHPAEAVGFLEELVKAVPWNADYRVRLAQARLAANQNPDSSRKELAAVASSPGAPYETRLSAARSLTAAGTADLGSRELTLLARGGQISPGEANQPFFFSARLKAAENLPASARIVLLRAALEDYPSGDAARVPLLKAAGANGDYELAIAVMKPFLQNSIFESAYGRRRTTDEDDELVDDTTASDGSLRDFMKLPAKEWAEINRDLGQAFEKTGAPDQALLYLRRAYGLETDAVVKSQINKQVQQIRAAQRRRTTNAARRPMVRTELEQEHVVRPRIPEPGPSTSPPPAAAPARKGAGL